MEFRPVDLSLLNGTVLRIGVPGVTSHRFRPLRAYTQRTVPPR